MSDPFAPGAGSILPPYGSEPPSHPDDGHSHHFTCIRCGVNPAEPRWPSGPDAERELAAAIANAGLGFIGRSGSPDLNATPHARSILAALQEPPREGSANV